MAVSVPSIFSTLRSTVDSQLASTVQSLHQLRQSPPRTLDAVTDPIDDETMGQLVDAVMHPLLAQIAASEPAQEAVRLKRRNDVMRQAIERRLEERLLDMATNLVEPSDSPAHLFDLLDLMQTFSERGHTDIVSPLNAISALLDVQTISQCQRTWSYIESRSARLTKDMIPGRGKGLTMLRMLNELLRRLPRSKQEHVIFSGRILVFLSSVFPLSEKSGVNLRGNFNTGKKTIYDEQIKTHEEEEDKVEPTEEGEEKPRKEEEEKKDDVDAFYPIFWGLQRVFTDPTALVAATPPLRGPDLFDTLKSQLSKTLDMFSDETKKEKQLAGAGGAASASTSKAQAASSSGDISEESLEHYFFPRFLTSRNLLKLELADPTFRRQILVQCLVLFQYLLSLTPGERLRAQANGMTNLLLLGTHEVLPAHEKWLKELRGRTIRELDAMEGGRKFREAIELILKREQHWVTWKLQSCQPFELPPLDAEDKSKIARSKLVALGRKPKNYPYKLGNPTLSRLWERSLTTLDGFEPDVPRDDFDSLLREWTMCGRLIGQKKTMMEHASDEKKEELKVEIEQLELRLSALHWRATRAASLAHLSLFSKIKAGDLDLLVKAIDDARRAAEEPAKPEKNGEGAMLDVDEVGKTTEEEGKKGDGEGEKKLEDEGKKLDEEAIEEGGTGEVIEEAVVGDEVEMVDPTAEDPALEATDDIVPGIALPAKVLREVLIDTDEERSTTSSPKRPRAENDAIEKEGERAPEGKRTKLDDE